MVVALLRSCAWRELQLEQDRAKRAAIGAVRMIGARLMSRTFDVQVNDALLALYVDYVRARLGTSGHFDGRSAAAQCHGRCTRWWLGQ